MLTYRGLTFRNANLAARIFRVAIRLRRCGHSLAMTMEQASRNLTPTRLEWVVSVATYYGHERLDVATGFDAVPVKGETK